MEDRLVWLEAAMHEGQNAYASESVAQCVALHGMSSA